MDPTDEEEGTWCDERRADVAQYLRNQGLQHGEIGEVAAWFVAPHISVWAIESLKSPGAVGWWAISGDMPTDYCSADQCRHPRLALRRIAERWVQEIAATQSGSDRIGATGLDIALMPLLRARATVLSMFAADDDAWPE
ncbi:MAG TPA: DUF4826 family protein [Caulobacteraceae bacterium]|jgi:hypothetical protein